MDPHPLLTPQAEKVLLFGFGAGLLTVLAAGFVATGAPVLIALGPFVLVVALTAWTRADLRHVAQHGWHQGPGADGPSGRDPGDPQDPNPQGPSGDVLEPEWDRFVSQFWEHVERDRQPVGS